MLHAGKDGVVLGEVVALITSCHGGGYEAAKVGVFTGAFGDSAPAGFHRNVAHGAVGPLEAGRCGFFGGNAGAFLNGVYVP